MTPQRILRTVAILGASALVLALPASAALEVRIVIVPKRPAALERTEVVLRTFAPLIREDGTCCQLEPHAARSYPFRVEAVSPTGKNSRIRVRHTRGNEWRGVVRFAAPGRWRVELPQFFESITVRVGSAQPTPPPAGLGAVGRVGCNPASPVNGSGEIFGTAVGDEMLWALPFFTEGVFRPIPGRAVWEGVVGEEIKIVFAMTTGRGPLFHAVGPAGAVTEPIWVQGHTGPTWVGIPGHQWGAGFVFPAPGCWRIRVGQRGDVFILIRS